VLLYKVFSLQLYVALLLCTAQEVISKLHKVHVTPPLCRCDGKCVPAAVAIVNSLILIRSLFLCPYDFTHFLANRTNSFSYATVLHPSVAICHRL